MAHRAYFITIPALAVLAAILLGLPSITLAETDSMSTDTYSADRFEILRTNAVDQASSIKANVDAQVAEHQRLIEQRRIELEERLEKQREEMQQYIDSLNDRTQQARDQAQQAQDRAEQTAEQVRERAEAMKQQADEARARADEVRGQIDAMRVRLEEKAQLRILAYIERVERRFNAALERLAGLGSRIESQTQKMNERGVDTSETEALLSTAYDSMVSAEAGVKLFIEKAEEAVQSDTPRDSFAEVRETLNNAKEEIKSTHQAFVDAVVALKAAGGIDNAEEDAGNDTVTETEGDTDVTPDTN